VVERGSRMARESAEGQAPELAWSRGRVWELGEIDYLRMVRKKTSYYTFITPVLLGGILAGADASTLSALRRFGAALGAAFQIQDDVLNVSASPESYGKDRLGDLREGKHTLIVLHMLRNAEPAERARALSVLSRPRPPSVSQERLSTLLNRLRAEHALNSRAHAELEAVLFGSAKQYRTEDDVEYLHFLICKYGSIEYARDLARRNAARAARNLHGFAERLRPSVHRDVLNALSSFVVDRAY